jgi:hypothetical protein
MSEQPAETTEELQDNYIAWSGTKCPTFVTETMFAETDDEHIHHVTFPDPEPYTRGDGRITVQAIIATDDGGIVTYDDGVSIFNRMFTDPERAVEVFRSTVALTAAESEGPVPQYDPGFEPVTFDDVSIEVQD